MTRQSEFVGEDRNAAAPKAVAAMSFEEALAELEGIVQKLERGQLDLEASIKAYERGTELRQHCAQKLREAELRVEKLSVDRNGGARVTPLDAE
ncbi:exodeoxyribonuclease VII small subunit [Geminicoccaceae bacterium 1502E]|nr:exodeoxyribonuclease VII small subunit [Geminicoccaceae bacterium 1502E]